ncbi:glycosyltransferase, partial [Candidatus Falkowbacteria bacterium]|nr:glycosyltransferase [Candidatus Falkowbacteria bacterium]
MNKQVTIGLVVWNGARYLRQCLDSVMAQSNQDFKCIILDNCSSDDSLAIAQEYVSRAPHLFEVWPYKVNVGFAKGHNSIMRATTTPYYMALNQDIVLHPEYLKYALQVISSRDDIGSVSGKILVWDFANNIFTNIIDSLGLTVKKWGQVVERSVGEVDHSRAQVVEEVFGVSGTVPIYAMSALRATAYESEFFDESFFSYKEDVDLAFRLRWAGYTSYVAHEAVA